MKPKDVISHLLPDTPSNVRVFSTLPSTNLTLHVLAREGAPDGTAVIAEGQSAGRGRLGREFASPRGAGLYMSVLLRRPIPADRVSLLTPYVAVAAARAIEELVPLSVGIKWVNDLRVGRAKIAGILTEGELSAEGGLSFAVLGIGINLLPNALPSHLAGIAAAIGDFAPPPPPERLAAAILNHLYGALPSLLDGSFLGEYRRRSVVLGQRVETVLGGRTISGIAEVIGDDGSLTLRVGEERIV
ncbi:MAG: biotin--[Clostridia bacterium]|nr:biotin--[acetyl-CoA-carboxylase] ligase [Clostridia bacterium]